MIPVGKSRPLSDVIVVGNRLEVNVGESMIAGIVLAVHCDETGTPAAVVIERDDGGYQSLGIANLTVQMPTVH